MLAEMSHAAFYGAALKIVWIDILLSGDNALIIALACQNLPAKKRFWGMALGALAAVLLRVTFTGIATTGMEWPFFKAVGAIALTYIAVKMLRPQDEDEANVHQSEKLAAAIGIIVVADITMSIDNVIAIAAAAKGDITLLAFGLLLSIPLIVSGAALISTVLNRFPVLLWAGAALLGYIAGELFVSDPVFNLPHNGLDIYAGITLAIMVLLAGYWVRNGGYKDVKSS